MFSTVSAFKVFDIFDPIGDAFADMEFTDIYFSQLLDDPVADTDVVFQMIDHPPALSESAPMLSPST